MGLLALLAGEANIIVAAIGGLSLVALVAFGLWWFKPFRSASVDASVVDERQDERWDLEDG
jgi:hypothetical protein